MQGEEGYEREGMRVMLKDFLTEEDATKILNDRNAQTQLMIRLAEIIYRLSGQQDVVIADSQFYYVRDTKNGHPLHIDGQIPHDHPLNTWQDKSNADWCKYSVSVLLTNDFEEGDFMFKTEEGELEETITRDQHYLGALIYTSGAENTHEVSPAIGNRQVFLGFFREVEISAD